jgi:nucleoside-diphosphate-sugar epimerase
MIIVTGSSGLIGHAVSEALAQEGYDIAAFDRPGPPDPPPSAVSVPMDLTSESSVRDAVENVRSLTRGRVASVVHLAAYYDFSGEPSELYDEVTVQGTSRLLRALAGLQVDQFVFASTMLVHAPCAPGQHINEDWPLEPKWDYPQSKVDTERLIARERHGIPSVVLRMSGVYTDRCESLPIANQIQRIYEKRVTSRLYPGDVSTGQSFMHLDDVVDAIRRVVARRRGLPDETVLLLGEEEPVSYDEMQRTLARLIHGDTDWDTREIPKAVAKAGAWVQDVVPGIEDPFIKPWMIDMADDHYALDTTRARTLLGWMPSRHLRETLPRMTAFLKADPQAFYRLNRLSGEPPRIGNESTGVSDHGREIRPHVHK